MLELARPLCAVPMVTVPQVSQGLSVFRPKLKVQLESPLAAMAAAMTPGGPGRGQLVWAADAPMTASGQTPNAKKPVNKETIAIAQGGSHPMTMDELLRTVVTHD